MARKSYVIVASECDTLVSTGGLGSTVFQVVTQLGKHDNNITLFLPRYRAIDKKKLQVKSCGTLSINMGVTTRTCALFTTTEAIDGVTVAFIEHNELFDRQGIYGDENGAYLDNVTRFSLFCHATLTALQNLAITPTAIHSFDWHCALIPLLSKTLYQERSKLFACKNVHSLQSILFQGIFPKDEIVWTGCGWSAYTENNLKFHDSINMTKSALHWSDAIITQSNNYTKEICNEENWSLAHLISKKKPEAIIHGLDYSLYDPLHDKNIASTYSIKEIEKKIQCKSTLQRFAGIALHDATPLMISRINFDNHNGTELFAITVGTLIASKDVALIIHYSGESETLLKLDYLSKIFPEKLSLIKNSSNEFERTLFSGADIFLDPSLHLPYQDSTFKALRYGTLPVVAKSGALPDLLTPWNRTSQCGNALLFQPNNERALCNIILEAIALYNSPQWLTIQKSCMDFRHPLERITDRYCTLYKK